MANIIPFNFNNTDVRVIERDGEPWFVAKDVATILGYTNPQDAVRRHCKAPQAVGGERNTHPSSVDPQTVIIPERDLYRLVMRSKLPSAERFEEWVVSEVLPAIRKTGGYNAAATMPDFTDPAAAARAWLHEYETRVYYETVLNRPVPQPAGFYIEALRKAEEEKAELKQALRESKLSPEKQFDLYVSRLIPFEVAAQGLGAEAVGALALLTIHIAKKRGKMQRDDRYLGGCLGVSLQKARSLTDKLIAADKIQTRDGEALTTNVAPPVFMSSRKKPALTVVE